MSQHTKEPWQEGTHELVKVNPLQVGYAHRAVPIQDYEQAKRCVNACAGLNPEKYGDVMEALQRCLILLGQVAFTDPKLETARRNEMDEGQAVYSAALRLAQEGR